MYNFLLGPSGAGKSFEAVVFHILPALRKGRKVITNLPLNIEELRKLNKDYPALIDLRTNNVEEVVSKNTWNPFHRLWDSRKVKVSHIPFASLADFGDEWRHPKTGGGALYVIDECHKCFPRGKTDLKVEEWFGEHRHEFADLLLITQSIGKVSTAIADGCQIVYRCRKAVALGTDKAYIRKVQDGLKGDVVNEAVRKYKPEFFKYYNSHTKSENGGSEFTATDIVPFWKRWPVIGAGVCFLGVFVLLLNGASFNPMKTAQAKTLSPTMTASGLPAGFEPITAPASAVAPVSAVQVVQVKPKQAHPFEGLTFHVVAFIESSTKWRYTFSADQNGQPVFVANQSHLEKSGYIIEKMSECSAKIIYQDISFYAVCDTSSVSLSRGLVGHS